MRKILLVHGIDDTHKRMRPLQRKLHDAGFKHVHTLDLIPNDGSISIAEMGRQVLDAVNALRQNGTEKVDVDLVGYSMGGLVSRYFIQRLGGKKLIRRFISLSAPHRGTYTGYLRGSTAVREMRPGSSLLRDLNGDPDPWGRVKVYSFWTPLDMMIMPAASARLHGAQNRTFFVAAHPLMLRSSLVTAAVINALV